MGNGRLLLSALLLSGCQNCSKGDNEAAVDATVPSPSIVLTNPDAAPVNATIVPTASVARYVNPQGLPAYTGPTGSVEGTITVKGDPAPPTKIRYDYRLCPDGEATYGKTFREGDPKEPGGPRWLGDAVVAITGYANYYMPERAEAKELTIEHCAFSQRTVTVTFGQRIDIKNLTKEFWSPGLEPNTKGIILMATPGGDPVKIYPKKPGAYHIVDHDRRWASIEVYVLLHPLHTASRTGGGYRIDGIPVGKVKVNTTHPALPDSEASSEVEIKAGTVSHVDLELQYSAPPPPPPLPADGAPPGGPALTPYPGQR